MITHLLAIRIAGDVDHGAHPLNDYLPSPNAKFLDLELEMELGIEIGNWNWELENWELFCEGN